jgi:transposase-like protein
MGKSQPTYTKEFKQQAVHLFETGGKSKTQIARDLGISDSTFAQMVQRIRRTRGRSIPW